MSDACTNSGTICAPVIWSRSQGMLGLHVWVGWITFPFGRVKGVGCWLFTDNWGTLFPKLFCFVLGNLQLRNGWWPLNRGWCILLLDTLLFYRKWSRPVSAPANCLLAQWCSMHLASWAWRLEVGWSLVWWESQLEYWFHRLGLMVGIIPII